MYMYTYIVYRGNTKYNLLYTGCLEFDQMLCFYYYWYY